jgi:SMI1 / KNR4 family (SUKH-1)
MDPRIPQLRRKLASIPFQAQRSQSFGEKHHKFRLGPKLTEAKVSAFESEHGIALPDAYRQFLIHVGGTGAAPFYGIVPLDRQRVFTMCPQEEPGAPRAFTPVRRHEYEGDLFLEIIEMGCTDLCAVAVTGPLTGRVLTGNSDGFWGPNVSSAADFLAWYGRWLDHMIAGRDDRAIHLTSPGSARPGRRSSQPS